MPAFLLVPLKWAAEYVITLLITKLGGLAVAYLESKKRSAELEALVEVYKNAKTKEEQVNAFKEILKHRGNPTA